MELILKCSAAGIFAALASLLIKRKNPEMSFALSAAAVCVILTAASKIVQGFESVSDTLTALIGKSGTQLLPLVKCLGIACITRISSELCKDCSQSALAAALEVVGTLCAAAVAVPLINDMLKLIGEMI